MIAFYSHGGATVTCSSSITLQSEAHFLSEGKIGKTAMRKQPAVKHNLQNWSKFFWVKIFFLGLKFSFWGKNHFFLNYFGYKFSILGKNIVL